MRQSGRVILRDVFAISSKKLLFSYVLDVLAIISFGLLGYAFSAITPNFRAFSVLDLSISYPVEHELVSLGGLILAAIAVPAGAIAFVCAFFVPRWSVAKDMRIGVLLRVKLWEFFTGWLGLGLALTTEFMLVQGMKNMVGRPRPDMLARCRPDLENIDDYTVGGFGQDISPRWVTVTERICTQTDRKVLESGFKSFPSGHAAMSFAGLLYLSLYLCSKFAVVFPYLPEESCAEPRSSRLSPRGVRSRSRSEPSVETQSKNENDHFIRHRDEAAAPPAYLLYFLYVPVGGAIYISLSRYFNYRHHAFDIVTGAAIGSICAFLAFRWYHLPVSRGSGWSWGPRSQSRAFAAGVGSHGFVDESKLMHVLRSDEDLKKAKGDIEVGNNETQLDQMEETATTREVK